MKVSPGAALMLMVPFVLAVPFEAQAKGKGKGKGGEQEQPAAATPEPEASPSNPVGALSPYIMNLDQLLALNRPANVANQPLFAQTSGRLLVLRQGLVAEGTSAAPEKKNQFAAAVKTVDLIGAALQDREKVISDMKSSQAVSNSGAIDEQAKKDNLAQGIKAHGIAKAEAIAAERSREKAAAANSKQQAAGGDSALSAMAVNNWNQRASQWHQQIAASFSNIK